jgi:O-antigen/teichoic acid export membrane protein
MKIFKKQMKDDLFRHSAIVFVSMMVVHVCNMAFQMVVGRVLPDEEYTLLAVFLGVLVIIQRPLATLRIGVNRYSSLLSQDGQTGDVKRLVRKMLLVTAVPALVLCAGTLLFSKYIAAFFHLKRLEPVLIFGAMLPAFFWTPIVSGAVQGVQKFGVMASATITGSMIRLLLGAGFVWFLYPACGWAMLGHGIGMYGSLCVLFTGLLLALRGTSGSGAPLPSTRSFLLQSFFIQGAYAVLMTADVVFMKHYVPSDTEFAYAATIGRMVVFLPGAIVMAMFPKVASRGTLSPEQRSVFLRSVGVTTVFVVVAVMGCFVFPGLLVRILFGIAAASPHLKHMVGMMSLIMGMSALLNIIIQFLLAQHRFSGLFGVILMAVIYWVGSRFCSLTWHVVALSAATNIIALVWVGIIAIKCLEKAGERSA